MYWCFSILLLALLGAVQALSSAGSRLLVVLEEEAEKSKYSQFFGDLDARGFSITYETAKSSSLNLFQHGARAYDHLLLLPTKSKDVTSTLSAKSLLEFIKEDGNILVTLSAESATPSSVSTFLLELDMNLPTDRTSVVVDHFNYDSSSASEKHDVLLLSPSGPLRSDLKDYFHVDGPLAVPRAVGQVLGNESPLLTPILRAPSTAYSYNPKDEVNSAEDPFAVGAQLSLVSALQARNSARCAVLGSAEMLENTWFGANVKGTSGKSKTANRQFAERLSAWTFKELGVLKVGRLIHYPTALDDCTPESSIQTKNGTFAAVPVPNPPIYRIKTEVVYQIELSEYSMTHLTPFTPPANDDVQLEFSMLSPFHRLSLSRLDGTANSTIYGTTFVLPDQHGIFNFRVNYKRPFLTTVDEKRQVTVRHFAHDEWPRSWAISGAWTWVAGVWAVVGGWVAFVALWLWSAPNEAAVGGGRGGGAKKVQ